MGSVEQPVKSGSAEQPRLKTTLAHLSVTENFWWKDNPISSWIINLALTNLQLSVHQLNPLKLQNFYGGINTHHKKQHTTLLNKSYQLILLRRSKKVVHTDLRAEGHSITCHSTQVNATHLNPSRTGWCSI